MLEYPEVMNELLTHAGNNLYIMTMVKMKTNEATMSGL